MLREVTAKVKAGAVRMDSIRRFAEDPQLAKKSIADWDAAALLKLMWDTWNDVFRDTLGHTERSIVSELRDWRNKWAHQERFSSDDADRALDSAERLLAAVSASEADEVAKLKRELRRLVLDEQVRGERRKAAGALVEMAAGGAVKPWRELATPHQDVANGRYQQAEFAADLWQVYLGEGADEYRDPAEFFRRTYLTRSLQGLLATGLRRLAGLSGDPVVQLQTNFGGGKTHSMLALHHLFSGAAPGELAGVEDVLAKAEVAEVAPVRRVVLVGNKISPGNPVTKPDGTLVRTLWGELAYQLGGASAFERIRADDENATNPGHALRELLATHGPCLILIDEWVSYARQLHDESDLPAGSFETQFTFAQTLTEAVKATENCLLVVSLPASDASGQGSPHAEADDSEVGGLRGREALERLRNVVARVESSWRPASAEEGFEIVRRRLFEPLNGPDAFKQRDVTARAFADLYRSQQAEFPSECRSADYERRIQAGYPIHPEIFDRLYSDWSALAKFQRTRGVLRLMAAVIHSLWESGDRNPLILPSTIPIDDARVQNELTRYLPDNWTPVIEKDVDGPNSLPLRIDAEVPNLGKLSATRRVARTAYLGSAPTTAAAHRGIDDGRVKLGCVSPGESPALFGDALRRLAAAATYLYQDGARVWYDTQPTVTKLAEDRAAQLLRDPDQAAMELERRLRDSLPSGRDSGGDFARIHVLPQTSADVPDDWDARLVVLSAEHPYAKEEGNPAQTAANAILETRGNAPRLFRNTLVFLAADKVRCQDLDEALRSYLAWRSILKDKNELNLDPHQTKQAEVQCQDGRWHRDRPAAGSLPMAADAGAVNAPGAGAVEGHSPDRGGRTGRTGRQAAAQRRAAGHAAGRRDLADAHGQRAPVARRSCGRAPASGGLRQLSLPAAPGRAGSAHASGGGRLGVAHLGGGQLRAGGWPRRSGGTLPRLAGRRKVGARAAGKPGPAGEAGSRPPATGCGNPFVAVQVGIDNTGRSGRSRIHSVATASARKKAPPLPRRRRAGPHSGGAGRRPHRRGDHRPPIQPAGCGSGRHPGHRRRPPGRRPGKRGAHRQRKQPDAEVHQPRVRGDLAALPAPASFELPPLGQHRRTKCKIFPVPSAERC